MMDSVEYLAYCDIIYPLQLTNELLWGDSFDYFANCDIIYPFRGIQLTICSSDINRMWRNQIRI